MIFSLLRLRLSASQYPKSDSQWKPKYEILKFFIFLFFIVSLYIYIYIYISWVNSFKYLYYAYFSMSLNSVLISAHIDFLEQALRQQFYTANNMHELFTKVKRENILDFLRAAGLYKYIISSRKKQCIYQYLEFYLH